MYTYTSPWISKNPNGNYQGTTQFANNTPAVEGIEIFTVGGQGVVNCCVFGYDTNRQIQHANGATNDANGEYDSNSVAFKSASTFNMQYQGGYGVVNVGINGQWAGTNFNGDPYSVDIPAGLTLVGLMANYQYGYGIVDMCLICTSETEMNYINWNIVYNNGQPSGSNPFGNF